MIQHLIPFTLVAFRIAGLFISAPMISSPMIPGRVKVLTAIALSGCVYPLTPAWPLNPSEISVLQLVPMVVGEALIGYVIGFLASMPIAAAEMGGVLVGQQMGYGLAKVYNPETDAESDVLSQLLMFMIFAGYLAGGGLEHVFRAVVSTFERVAPGGIGFTQAPLQTMLGVLGSSLELAIRIAMPVAAAILLLIVVFAVIAKTMPAINIMSVGFTVKVLAGIAILTIAMPVIGRVCGDELHDVMNTIDQWSRTLTSPQASSATGGTHG
ncbi:MAG: flagellar biosynthetic protein FliR [Phycisphaerales bacterium]|nr:flagellar biosynthetic protein FliR [Phycisphaerales bacterium]